jgi:type III secretion protein C
MGYNFSFVEKFVEVVHTHFTPGTIVMYRPLLRAHILSKVLLTMLALLQANPLAAEGVLSRREAKKSLKEAKGEATNSNFLETRAKKLVAEAEVKPSDFLRALDLPPEIQELKPRVAPQVEEAPSPQEPPAEEEAPLKPAASTPTPKAQVPAPAENIPELQPLPPTPPQEPEDEQTKTPTGKEKFLVNLSNVSMAEYIRFISRISNKNFLFNEDQLNFNVTIISEELTTLDEIMASLMNELRIHGLSLIEQGNNIIIHNNPTVNSPSVIVPTPQNETIPPNTQIVTRVFKLRSFDPTKAKSIIAPLLSTQAVIEPLPETGFLILTDLSTNVEKVGELLSLLDSPVSGLEIAQYRARSMYVDSLAGLAQRILAPLSDEGRKIQFIPFRQTNTLFIVSSGPLLEKALTLLEQIDGGDVISESLLPQSTAIGIFPEGVGPTPSSQSSQRGEIGRGGGIGTFGPGGRAEPQEIFRPQPTRPDEFTQEFLPQGHLFSTDFDLYKLQYRKGDQIQQALQSIAVSLHQIEAQTAQNNAMAGIANVQNELASAIGSVQWLEATNTLVFTGTRAANNKLKDIIRDLDIQNDQVLIELLLLDTTLEDSLEYGVDFESKFGGHSSAGATANRTTSSNPLTRVMDQIPTNGILNASNLAKGAGFSLGIIGQNLIHMGSSFGSIGALVRAIHRNLDSRVVLNQKIVVEDNQTAEIFVGLNIPYKTQSLANDFGTILTNNFEYRDVGARLTVTPFINKNGKIITLQLSQEVTTLLQSVVTSTSVAFEEAAAGPSTRKSNTRTTIFVPDGYFVILSGNIQDEDDRTRHQVPCLGGVPVLGSLFAEKKNRDSKRALMIFLRPMLINSKQQMRDLTKREQDIYNQQIDKKDLWQYEVNEALDFLNIPAMECAD